MKAGYLIVFIFFHLPSLLHPEYNDLKTELTDYLRRFADEGTVRHNSQNSQNVFKYC